MALVPGPLTEPAPPLLGRQKVRRALAISLSLICVAFVEEPALGVLVGHDWQVMVTLVLLALLILLNIVLRESTRGIALAAEDTLDERQEATRNRAYRLSHKLLAAAFGLPLWLILVQFGQPTWLPEVTNNGGLMLVYLELLYFLPTVIIAWLEPDAPPDDDIRHRPLGWPERLTWMGLVALLLFPFALSASLLFATYTSAVQIRDHGSFALPQERTCTFVSKSKSAGVGPLATIHLAGSLCWNGRQVWPVWGFAHSDCQPASYFLTTVDMRCSTTFTRNGTIHIRYLAMLKPSLLPIFHRQIEISFAMQPNGHIAQFR